MFKNKRDLFNIGLLVIFIWLLITSYSSSKRKPENGSSLITTTNVRNVIIEIINKCTDQQ